MVKKIDESDNKTKKFIKNKMKNTLVSKIKNKFKFKLQKDKSKKELTITKKEKARKIILESVKDHFFTFRLTTDLFTLLYTTLVFKWIQTEKVVIIVDDNKIGYHLELFLRHFRMSAIFLDCEMPVNTNKHFCAQFLKGSYTICITSSKFEENSPNFAEEILENTPIPATIIYFDTISKSNLEFHCYHSNTKAIYHFIAANKKTFFSEQYEDLPQNITFQEYKFDEDQLSHLRYRCEDIYHSIHKNDIKKAKLKRINQELLNSKDMQDYFKEHPEEKKNVIKAIDENSIKSIKPSALFLPSYLIHNEGNGDNIIADAIKKTYAKSSKSAKRKGKGKMEKYLESLEKADGSENLIKF